MCGRFSLGLPHDEVEQLHGYNVQVGEWVARENFHPRHNIAPRSNAPVIRRRRNDVDDAGPSHSADDPASPEPVIMQTMKWGLVPHWSKHDDGNLNTINARSENLVEGGGMWGSIKGRKRCAVPCEGYYEWLKKGKERLPHFTKRSDGRLLLLAGMYDCVTLEGQTEPLWTFTIVTTDANKEFDWLHDRQPVILSTIEALNTWLDTSSNKWTGDLTNLVQPYHDETAPLTCYQVPKEVGKIGTESATFIEPVSQRRDGIEAMFAKQKVKSASTSPTKSADPPKTKRKRGGSLNSQDVSRKKHEGDEEKPSCEVVDLCDEDEDDETNEPPVEKLNAWDDDSEIEYIDTKKTSSSPSKVNSTKSKKTIGSSPSKTVSPKKVAKDGQASITSFFQKPKA